MDQVFAIEVSGVKYGTDWRFLPKRFTAGNLTTSIYWAFAGTQEECELKIKKFKREYPKASEGVTFTVVPLSGADLEKYHAEVAYKERQKRNGRLSVSLADDGTSLVVMSENKNGKKGQKAFFELMKHFGLTIRTTKDGREYISVRIDP